MTDVLICTVCSGSADETNASDCYSCGALFHLNQRNDVPGKDCGDVWVSDESLALEFACRTCLDLAMGIAPPGAIAEADEPKRRRYRRID